MGEEGIWRFKAVIEGDLVQISASFDYAGVERFREKIIAVQNVLAVGNVEAPDKSPDPALKGEG